MKTCYTCKIDKAEEEFSWKVKNEKRSGVCKECHKAYRKKHYQSNRQKYIDKARAWDASQGGRRMLVHGISDDKWERLLARYDGKCWICRTRPGTAIDHDHNCCPPGKSCEKCFRGILCMECNTGLGKLGDNEEGLLRALEYLRSSKKNIWV